MLDTSCFAPLLSVPNILYIHRSRVEHWVIELGRTFTDGPELGEIDGDADGRSEGAVLEEGDEA
jgi:hypothetical protein